MKFYLCTINSALGIKQIMIWTKIQILHIREKEDWCFIAAKAGTVKS